MTPYDAALRIAERKLDAVRTAIGLIVAELERIEHARIAIETSLTREAELASRDHRLTTEHFFVHARDQHQQLVGARAAAHLQLEALRRKAVADYGAQVALEGAAAEFREAADRARDAAEQSALDDRIGARHAARRRASAGVAATAAP